MNLIQWKGNKIEIAPEAYGIKVFRNIWNADRSQSKDKAIMTLSTLYFMYDPRSEYQFEIDREERLKRIKEETGLPSNWRPDKLFNDAIPVYKYLTLTTSAITLASNRSTLEKVKIYLDNVTVNDDNITKIIKAISDRNELAVAIAKAEKEIYKDVEEYSAKIRGKGKKTIGDAGLDSLFKEEIEEI